MLESRELTIKREHSSPLRFNNADSAHFISHYTPDHLKLLVDQVKDGQLDVITRLQLLHEQTLLARAGIIKSAELLPLLNAYANETNEHIWDIIALTIGELKKFVEDDKLAEDKLRELSGRLAKSQYQRLGWQTKADEPEDDTKLRATIISLMIYSQDTDVLAIVKEIYTNQDIDKINPELRATILSAVVHHELAADVIDNLLEIYQSTASADLQLDIATSLTSSKQDTVNARLITLLKGSTIIRNQDISRWFVYLIRNRYSRSATWQWMKDNWLWIEEVFGGDKSFDDFPRYSASGLASRQLLDDYRQFFTPLQSQPALKRVIQLGITEIEARVELIERDGEDVCRALKEL